MDPLQLESAIALPNFLEGRKETVRAVMRRGPWESECFIGEYNFYNFVGRVFGRHATFTNYLLNVWFPINILFMWTAKKSNFTIQFLHLSYSTWIIFAVTWILIYHFQDEIFDSAYNLSRDPAINNFVEHSEVIRRALQERNSLESVSIVIRRMLTRHAFYMYFVVIAWFATNFVLLVPAIQRLPLKPELLVNLCFACVLSLLVRLSGKIYRRI